MKHFGRFSLRTLVMVMTVLAVWIGLTANRANRQRHAVEQLQAQGARVSYAHEYTFDNRHSPVPRREVANAPLPGPDWLRKLVGDHYFVTPIRLWHVTDLAPVEALPDVEEIYGLRLASDDIDHLRTLTKLKVLMLNQRSRVDDFGFLSSFPELVHFAAVKVPFDDADAVHLRGTPKLRWLQLQDTPVSDAGLVPIVRLSQLQYLNLRGTEITDDGVKLIAGLRNLLSLDLAGTKVTDTGLASLASLPKLNRLNLSNTAVSNDGMQHLARMPTLISVTLTGARLNGEGMSELRRALPGAAVNP